MPLTAGSDGVSTGCHPPLLIKLEAVSKMGCIAQTEPDTPQPPAAFGFHGVHPCSASLETHSFSFLLQVIAMGTVLARKVVTTDAFWRAEGPCMRAGQ